MLGLMIKSSDDNSDINEEWGQTSIANDDINTEQMIANHDDNPNHGIDQISIDKRQISIDSERTETTNMHSASMSYMSNNTIMLKELSSMDTGDELDIDNEGMMNNDHHKDHNGEEHGDHKDVNGDNRNNNEQEHHIDDDDDDSDSDDDDDHHHRYHYHDETATMIINGVNITEHKLSNHKLSNCSNNYMTHLNEHDQIISSPIKISANQSFKVTL